MPAHKVTASRVNQPAAAPGSLPCPTRLTETELEQVTAAGSKSGGTTDGRGSLRNPDQAS